MLTARELLSLPSVAAQTFGRVGWFAVSSDNDGGGGCIGTIVMQVRMMPIIFISHPFVD